jgi:hypothetical protein
VYRRVNFGWKRNLNLIFVSVNTNAHSFFNISGSHTLPEANNKFGDLLHVDYIFGFICICVNNFRTTSDLKRLLLLLKKGIEKKSERSRNCTIKKT